MTPLLIFNGDICHQHLCTRLYNISLPATFAPAMAFYLFVLSQHFAVTLNIGLCLLLGTFLNFPQSFPQMEKFLLSTKEMFSNFQREIRTCVYIQLHEERTFEKGYKAAVQDLEVSQK